MKKKKLKKRIKNLEIRVLSLENDGKRCFYCKNFETKKVEWRRFRSLEDMYGGGAND